MLENKYKEVSTEQQRLSLNGSVELLRGKGIEANVIRKLLNYIRTTKYED